MTQNAVKKFSLISNKVSLCEYKAALVELDRLWNTSTTTAQELHMTTLLRKIERYECMKTSAGTFDSPFERNEFASD
jgi:hypothetical protein